MRIIGQVIVVTGASRGIGKATAELLARKGARVALLARSPEVEVVAAEIVATGAEACERALHRFGAKRLGGVTPYQQVGDANVVRFFNEIGFDVVKIKGLRCPTAVSIAHVQEAELRQALIEVNVNDVDALVQAGTNLSMVRLADEAERWLGKPVIAINAAIWWMALRDNGIEDKVYGCGRLLRE